MKRNEHSDMVTDLVTAEDLFCCSCSVSVHEPVAEIMAFRLSVQIDKRKAEGNRNFVPCCIFWSGE